MSRLLLAELNRLRSRLFTIIALLAVAGILALLQLAVNSEVSPPDPSEIAANRAQFEQAQQDWEKNHAEWEKDCVESGSPPQECVIPVPTEADFGLEPTPFALIAGVSLQIATYLTALAMFLIAASFIGAEFSSGSIGNWLSFVPRRGLVFASKLSVIVVAGLVVGAVACFGVVAAAAAITAAHGGALDGLAFLYQQAARGVSVAVILAVLGFCTGLIGRHTAAALGVLLGYLFVAFVRNAFLFSSGWAQELTRWSPEGNLAAIVENGHRYVVPTQRVTPTGVAEDIVERIISLTHGVVYWAVVLAVVIVVTWVIFRRRDVT